MCGDRRYAYPIVISRIVSNYVSVDCNGLYNIVNICSMFPHFFFLPACFSKNWKSFTNPNLIFVNDKNIDPLHMGIFPEGRWTIHGCLSNLFEFLICAKDL